MRILHKFDEAIETPIRLVNLPSSDVGIRVVFLDSWFGDGDNILAAASGIFTGVHSIVKNKRNPGLLTSSAVLNSGVTAFLFFGCREFAISPLLTHFASGEQYAHRRRELGISPLTKNEASSLQQMLCTDVRWNKLLDSGLSGMLTGGALRGFRAGVRAIVPGAMVVGAACTILQYGYNELSIARLRYLSNLRRSTTAAERGDWVADQAPHKITDPAFQPMLKLFGIVPISDEEYLAKLRKTRQVYAQRIAELEKQVEEETPLKDPPKQPHS